jgi:hypothetical protein
MRWSGFACLTLVPNDPVVKFLANVAGIEWLRNNSPNPEDVDDTTVRSLSNLAGVPLPDDKLTPQKKQKALDDAVECLRNTNPRAENLDNPMIQALVDASSASPTRAPTDSFLR